MGQAVGIGALLVLIGVVCFAVGPIPTLLLITLVIGAATLELVGTLHQAGYNPAGLVVIVGTVGLLFGAFFGGPSAYPIVIALLVITTLLWYLLVHQGDQVVLNIGVTLFATLYVGGLGSFAALMAGYPVWANLDGTKFDNKYGIGLLLTAVIASVSYDIAGYFVGRSLGATPLGPTLRKASPNKTVEGLIAGVIVSIIATFAFSLQAKLPILGAEEVSVGRPVVGLLALGCALIAPLGDLCESMIKRDLDIKDMSQTLPGHGGILDRFDALLFVLPVAYFIATTFS
jgi:phosphatidate cytidylyltransferase